MKPTARTDTMAHDACVAISILEKTEGRIVIPPKKTAAVDSCATPESEKSVA
jgi:hypothetical protein